MTRDIVELVGGPRDGERASIPEALAYSREGHHSRAPFVPITPEARRMLDRLATVHRWLYFVVALALTLISFVGACFVIDAVVRWVV